jgi:hypothetical protein
VAWRGDRDAALLNVREATGPNCGVVEARTTAANGAAVTARRVPPNHESASILASLIHSSVRGTFVPTTPPGGRTRLRMERPEEGSESRPRLPT